jgi:RnfABCDGE-type electron transport complex G subunit
VRDILRLSLTLAFVGLVSAAALTGMENLTAPIIAERQEAEYRQALELFFPDFESFETERIEDDYFDLISDGSGNLVGIMSTIQQAGYDGFITYNLALNKDGEIVGLLIISHSETPGIGDVITTEPFQEQFFGKSYADPIVAGDDVDTVSGATVSTAAMITSIRRVVGVVAENYLGQETVVIDISKVPDGIYEGSAPGVGGPLVVSVEVSGGMITAINILEHSETPTYYIESYPLIPDLIIAEQSFEVDTKTGATISANAIVEAVQNALTGASGEETGGGQ